MRNFPTNKDAAIASRGRAKTVHFRSEDYWLLSSITGRLQEAAGTKLIIQQASLGYVAQFDESSASC
jgi:hypothetical protein